ncbi:OB-fold domain-containing protein [Corticibacterium sp. UT-5YL-CI-8]|nr:OB-fold domain-containing protein [Tianweitania sp. UT-5YL-CI-8]
MSFPQPADTPVAKPYWEALKRGELVFQRCRHCGESWLPARESCPRCLSPENDWVKSNGRGEVVSWIVYHTAYDEAFGSRVPYDVTLVKLDEGPQLLTNVVDSEAGKRLKLGSRVRLKVESEGDVALARFQLDDD